MAELLVRVVDKVNEADPYADVKCLKRGDVVAICRDGWEWSPAERKNPDWRIIQVPKLSVEEAEVFLAPEFDKDPLNPSRMLQRRAFKFDLDAVPPDAKASLDDAKRAEAVVAISLESLDVLALKVAKPAVADPNVFEAPLDPVEISPVKR